MKTTKKQQELISLFDSQIATLKSLNTPEVMIREFTKQRTYTLQEAWRWHQENLFAEGSIPFLPVIPLSHRGIYDLMAMISTGGRPGINELNPLNLRDEENFGAPYYIFDVNCWRTEFSPNFEEASLSIKSAGRSALNIEEVIALCVHKAFSTTLEKLLILFAGSSIWGVDVEDAVPSVWYQNDYPALSMHTYKREFKHEESVRSILPSCKARRAYGTPLIPHAHLFT